ncbi:MAG: 3-dehydroquinate synthase [Bacillota bacterium]
MQKITMHTSKTYDILIEEGLLASAAEHIAEIFPPGGGRRCCLVCDKTVYRLYGHQMQPLHTGLTAAGYSVHTCSFDPGESSKTLKTAAEICRVMASKGFTRDDFVLALGGGVCGDLAGFAASIYMRGVPFVQIPTTLLAMADSSIGGKTGVNTDAGKNMIGTFWQPSMVLIDPKVLETLSQDEILNGLAEIIKAGFIADGTIFDSLSEDLTEAIVKSIQVKKEIVESDEREDGRRRLLNFGHTVGHAIEKCSGYEIPHGCAVMNGMYITSLAADELGWSSAPVAGLIRNVIDAFAYPLYKEFSAEQLAEAAAADKKRVSDNIVIVYPERPGCCEMKELPAGELKIFIARGLAKEVQVHGH